MKSIVVIGGGLSGSAAAIQLARAGREVTVLEREAGPHEKVCGEFLSVEACHDLDRLGLSPATLGAAPIDRVRLHHGTRSIEARLPFLAQGLSRKVLDEALQQLASGAGAQVMRAVRVSGIASGTVLSNRGDFAAEEILLASGKHDLRGEAREFPREERGYVGFKMHWRLDPGALAELGSAVELILFDGGYAGLQRVGQTDANLCLVARQSELSATGGDWPSLLGRLMREPIIARRLGNATALFAKPLAIANLPYGFVHRPSQADAAHVWRLGDQAAATASLTGDGMAIALRSARLAADMLVAGQGAACFHRSLEAQTRRQVHRAMLLHRMFEHPIALAVGSAAARIFPQLLPAMASATRLPSYSLRVG